MIPYLVHAWVLMFFVSFGFGLWAFLDGVDDKEKKRQARRILFWIGMFVFAPICAPLLLFYGLFRLVQRPMPLA